MGHPTTTLEDLFLRIVEESKARPGRRFLPGKETSATGREDGHAKPADPDTAQAIKKR
jgi:hypothetical protein